MAVADQNERTIDELNALGQEWAKAELNADTTFLNQLLTDDFIGVGPLGFVLNKKQWLIRHTSGDLKFTAFTWEDVQTRPHGDAAIVVGRQTQVGTHKTDDATAQLRITQVYVRNDGAWKLAGLQMSGIQMPPRFNSQQR